MENIKLGSKVALNLRDLNVLERAKLGFEIMFTVKDKARLENIKIGFETASIIKKGYYIYKGEKIFLGEIIRNSEEEVSYFFRRDPAYISEINGLRSSDSYETEIEIITEATTSAIIKENYKSPTTSIGALNFANSTQKGGGFTLGYKGQEEDIFRNTTILAPFHTRKADSYYGFHKQHKQAKKDSLYQEVWLTTPKVAVIRSIDGSLLRKPICTTFISTEAVFTTKAREEGVPEAEIINAINRMADTVLFAFLLESCETIILSNFHCNKYSNSSDDIIKIFKKHLQDKYKNCHLLRPKVKEVDKVKTICMPRNLQMVSRFK